MAAAPLRVEQGWLEWVKPLGTQIWLSWNSTSSALSDATSFADGDISTFLEIDWNRLNMAKPTIPQKIKNIVSDMFIHGLFYFWKRPRNFWGASSRSTDPAVRFLPLKGQLYVSSSNRKSSSSPVMVGHYHWHAMNCANQNTCYVLSGLMWVP